ncbi:hypothetical protein MRB53_014214 [Persea americana]|uniref:Uncharacterized protein n=1 Tax=Persea americana TaxID=3435 RepID=A0ACC2KAU4_PERAE|nr:hypothetical protein MRB53_014214 [Persea americana]
MDPSINKEEVSAKEFPTAADSEEMAPEPPVQPSEVQGSSHTRAADYLEEQLKEVMDDSEGEREMDISITPFGEGTSYATPIAIEGSAYKVDSLAVPQTPDDVSLELAPLPVLLKE